jgi:hypothetical protein
LLAIATILIISLFQTTVFASPITVQVKNYQATNGYRVGIFFESANLATSSTPTVNTATKLSSSTGNTTLSQGTSGYLTSPQFSSATALGANSFTVNLWAASTPRIDGNNSVYINNANSGSVSLTTSQTYNVIYVTVAVRSSTITVNTPTATGLTFTARGSATSTNYGKIWAFYAITSTTAFSGAISVTLSGSARAYITAFGISGANTSNPFATTLQTASTTTGSVTPSVSINPTQKNTLIIRAAFIYCASGTNPTATAGNGYAIINNNATSNYLRSVSEFKNWSNTGSQTVSFTLSTSTRWAIIAEAIIPAQAISLNLSAYTVSSSGIIQNTLFSNQATNFTLTNPQIAFTYKISACTISASGYIQIKITAAQTCPICIYWGNVSSTNYSNSTNFQFPYG